MRQLSSYPAAQHEQVSNQTVRINSRFDYNGALYKVAAVDHNEQVLAVCLWGQQVGLQLTLPLALVIELVNKKRG